jgi:hypothetical protein
VKPGHAGAFSRRHTGFGRMQKFQTILQVSECANRVRLDKFELNLPLTPAALRLN